MTRTHQPTIQDIATSLPHLRAAYHQARAEGQAGNAESILHYTLAEVLKFLTAPALFAPAECVALAHALYDDGVAPTLLAAYPMAEALLPELTCWAAAWDKARLFVIRTAEAVPCEA